MCTKSRPQSSLWVAFATCRFNKEEKKTKKRGDNSWRRSDVFNLCGNAVRNGNTEIYFSCILFNYYWFFESSYKEHNGSKMGTRIKGNKRMWNRPIWINKNRIEKGKNVCSYYIPALLCFSWFFFSPPRYNNSPGDAWHSVERESWLHAEMF